MPMVAYHIFYLQKSPEIAKTIFYLRKECSFVCVLSHMELPVFLKVEMIEKAVIRYMSGWP